MTWDLMGINRKVCRHIPETGRFHPLNAGLGQAKRMAQPQISKEDSEQPQDVASADVLSERPMKSRIRGDFLRIPPLKPARSRSAPPRNAPMSKVDSVALKMISREIPNPIGPAPP